MKPLRRTNRATVQWIADRVLEYAQDYEIARQAWSGETLTAAEQSRWSVQMMLHQLTVKSGEVTDRELLGNPDPLSYLIYAQLMKPFDESFRGLEYDEFMISEVIAKHIYPKPNIQQVLRAPGAHYALNPLDSIVHNPDTAPHIRESIRYGAVISLLDLPQYRLQFQRIKETLRSVTDNAQRLSNTDREYMLVAIEKIHTYAQTMLLAMIQETNMRITYRDDLPYEWQHHRFVAALESVVAEHHDTIQRVLYTAGMSVRGLGRSAFRHTLRDALHGVATMDHHLGTV